jgi:hypothetical protein
LVLRWAALTRHILLFAPQTASKFLHVDRVVLKPDPALVSRAERASKQKGRPKRPAIIATAPASLAPSKFAYMAQ